MTNGMPMRALCLILLMTLTACGLPRSGPSRNEVLAGGTELEGNIHIVPVTDAVSAAAKSINPLGFSAAFRNAPALRGDRIAPGDTLGVTVWENIENGLLATLGQKVTMLEQIQVDQDGMIFLPYAGRLKAAGQTPDGLRRIIAERLQGQTPDPQIEVRRLSGDGATVTLMGKTGQGIYPIKPQTRRLSAMLANAGGASIPDEVAQIRIMRGQQQGRIWLQDLYNEPKADIALRPGDKIIVEEDQRSFTALGASGIQKQVQFTSRALSVLDAIAEVGGLNAERADPTGVFIFRDEPSHIANRVLARKDLRGDQRFAYVIDLTKPTGMFIARAFTIRDGDTMYVTEAPFAAWNKIMATTLSTVNNATALSKVPSNFSQ